MDMSVEKPPISLCLAARTAKRSFDIFASATGLLFLGWMIAIGWVVATLDTRKNGFYFQPRIGFQGKTFHLIKLRTMRDMPGAQSTVTVKGDPRITFVGSLLRRWKLDELPQLANVLLGDMSLVGPRPDVSGYADELETGTKALLLSVRPGITGPATIAYRNEEDILSKQPDPEKFNDTVIYPEKVRLNIAYIGNWGFWTDIKYILKTIFGS